VISKKNWQASGETYLFACKDSVLFVSIATSADGNLEQSKPPKTSIFMR